MAFKGRGTSTILLAECGCTIPTPTNGLGRRSLVDPTYILSKPLYEAGEKKCGPEGAQAPGCKAVNSVPVCKAIAENSIYAGAYDYISTFTTSPQVWKAEGRAGRGRGTWDGRKRADCVGSSGQRLGHPCNLGQLPGCS